MIPLILGAKLGAISLDAFLDVSPDRWFARFIATALKEARQCVFRGVLSLHSRVLRMPPSFFNHAVDFLVGRRQNGPRSADLRTLRSPAS